MVTDQELKHIISTQYVILVKPNCPFCSASYRLFDQLVDSKVISEYSIYSVNYDFSNQQLHNLCTQFGWQPDGDQDFPTKPQIFMKGEYIGGNSEFYRSNWNIGTGKPNLKNPMRF